MGATGTLKRGAQGATPQEGEENPAEGVYFASLLIFEENIHRFDRVQYLVNIQFYFSYPIKHKLFTLNNK